MGFLLYGIGKLMTNAIIFMCADQQIFTSFEYYRIRKLYQN